MSYLDFYDSKRILITGGTGSIGSRVVQTLAETDAKITILSRGENLQHDLSTKLPRTVKFIIGDIRDRQTVIEAVRDKNIVIHTAAMKHVSACEDNVFEAVRTNILGAENLREACVLSNVENIVICSTDKAADPVGTMGMTKALQERIFLQSNMFGTTTTVTRFGNVLGSRGSVVWSFKEKASQCVPIPITDANMLRYVMTPKQAAEVILWAGSNELNKCIVTKQMPSCYIVDLAKAIYPDAKIEIVGIRPGEKLEETLFNENETRFLYLRSTEIGNLGIINKTLTCSVEPDVTDAFAPKREILDVHQIREFLREAEVL